jgi:phosphatidylserine decarboxylase
VISLLAPVYSWALAAIAYGPWGFLHRVFIFIFRTLYKIDYGSSPRFKNLGEFFLRPVPITLKASSLVSPVEGFCFEGPSPIDFSQTISAKRIDYSWSSFHEISPQKFHRGMYWNLYLAPQNYHWVHSPTSGGRLEGFRTRGARLPVNAFGRWLEPRLYAVNERICFRFQSAEFGEILLLCIGAMGVSSLYSEKGGLRLNEWTPLQDRVEKGERLLGFRLGSTVLMVTERPPPSPVYKTVVRVGDELF